MHKVNYETFWQGKWNDTTAFGPACRHRRRIIGKLIRALPHESVLDLGCGDGSLLAELARNVDANLSGADISREALNIARQNLPGRDFFQIDLESDFMLERRFDIILMSEVLEHVENDEAVLRQVAPACRYLIVSVPGGPADKIARRYGHFRNYPGRLLADKMQRSGFDVIALKRWGWPFYDMQQRHAYKQQSSAAISLADECYSPARKAFARLIYLLYFLMFPGLGMQVFAVGRSRLFTGSSRPAPA